VPEQPRVRSEQDVLLSERVAQVLYARESVAVVGDRPVELVESAAQLRVRLLEEDPLLLQVRQRLDGAHYLLPQLLQLLHINTYILSTIEIISEFTLYYVILINLVALEQ